MAWFLFIDESGQDHKESPYEVLAGVAIEDRDLWGLVQELHDSEVAHFGRRYSEAKREMKATKILKRKTFNRAKGDHEVLPNEVPALSKEILDDGENKGIPRHLKALSLAKIAYVSDVFSICERHACKVFASIVEAWRGAVSGVYTPVQRLDVDCAIAKTAGYEGSPPTGSRDRIS
jgi:Protein of unknown function (DUF3800)